MNLKKCKKGEKIWEAGMEEASPEVHQWYKYGAKLSKLSESDLNAGIDIDFSHLYEKGYVLPKDEGVYKVYGGIIKC